MKNQFVTLSDSVSKSSERYLSEHFNFAKHNNLFIINNDLK